MCNEFGIKEYIVDENSRECQVSMIVVKGGLNSLAVKPH